jgi:voltage-gated sodium channel
VTVDLILSERVRDFVERDIVRHTILAIIVFNAISLGLSTSEFVMSKFGSIFIVLDRIVLTIFVIELLLKLFAYRMSFFRNAWNVFDLLIVSLGLLPQSEGLSALRGLRVIRALRLLSAMPQMRAVVQALLAAVPGMGAVIIMISIVFYVFGVMATMMYGATFNVWFGTLGRSLYTLFQIMTLESWSMGIVRPVMAEHPTAWIFFVPFIVITAFSVLNLFIGLLVNTMQTAVEEDTDAEFENFRNLIYNDVIQLNKIVTDMHLELREMRAEIKKINDISDD